LDITLGATVRRHEHACTPAWLRESGEYLVLTILGVYGANSPSEITGFESFLGRNVDAIHGVVGMANWWDYTQSANWMANDLWKDLDRPVLWSVPLLVWDGNPTLAQAASGQFNNQYESVARSILASRSGDSDPIYIRTGWELNLPGFPWSAIGKEQDFIGAFREFVDSFRDVSGRFKFEWNINHSFGPDPMKAYPGDNYVDVMGMDIYYNKGVHGNDAASAWNYALNAPFGLKWFEATADAHGKPTAYSEWGVDSNDGASYIRNMDAWFESHDVVYQSYWNSAPNGIGKLTDWHIPQASNAYRDAFRDESDIPAPSPAPSAPVTPWQPEAPSAEQPASPPGRWYGATAPGQTVTGSAGSDVLHSAGGNTLRGLGGNDTYEVSSANDRVIEAANGGVDTVSTWIKSFTLPDHVENLTLIGTGWSTGIGNGLNNVITGNASINRIDGAGGNDTLTGGGGSDTFVIGKGEGHDTITDFRTHAQGGAADMLVFEGFGWGARITHSGDVFSIHAQDGSVTQVTLTGVSNLGGNDYIFS
jgi:hypothetical protein